jgi:hypothetical protein
VTPAGIVHEAAVPVVFKSGVEIGELAVAAAEVQVVPLDTRTLPVVPGVTPPVVVIKVPVAVGSVSVPVFVIVAMTGAVSVLFVSV